MPGNILDRWFLNVPIRRALFNCFLFIFILTALTTLAGLIRLLPMEPQYLDKLFNALILELVGGIIGMFLATFGKGILKKTESDIKVKLIFPDTVDIIKPTPIVVKFTLFESDTFIDPISGESRAYKDGESLFIDLKEVPLDKNLLVEVEIDGELYQGAQYLRIRPLELTAIRTVTR